MLVGDLVRVKEKYSKYTPRHTGIIISIDEKFYKHPENLSKRTDRVHVLWDDGTNSTEPEQYVEIISGVTYDL